MGFEYVSTDEAIALGGLKGEHVGTSLPQWGYEAATLFELMES